MKKFRCMGLRMAAVVFGVIVLSQCGAGPRSAVRRSAGGPPSVVAHGMGQDVGSAVADAQRVAIEMALGAYVDSKTRLQNDELFERVSVASSGSIRSTEVLWQSVAEDGLVRVKVRVVFAGDLLQSRAREFDVEVERVDGQSLAAQASTKLYVKNVAEKLIVQHHLRAPAGFVRFKVEESPVMLRQGGDQVWVGVTLVAEPDFDAVDAQVQYLWAIAEALAQAGDRASVGWWEVDPARSFSWGDLAASTGAIDAQQGSGAGGFSRFMDRKSGLRALSLLSATDWFDRFSGVEAEFGPGTLPTRERGLGLVAFEGQEGWVGYPVALEVAFAFASGAVAPGVLAIDLVDGAGARVSGSAFRMNSTLESAGFAWWGEQTEWGYVLDANGRRWLCALEGRNVARNDDLLRPIDLSTGGLHEHEGLYASQFGRKLRSGANLFAVAYGAYPILSFARGVRLSVRGEFGLRIAIPVDADRLSSVETVTCRVSSESIDVRAVLDELKESGSFGSLGVVNPSSPTARRRR